MCNEYLLPIDHPVLTIFDSTCTNGRRIRTRPRLRQGKARYTLSFDSGDKILFLLLLIAVVEDIVGPSAEGEGDKRSSELHGDQGRHHRTQVCSTIFLWCVDAPEAHLFGLHL